MWDNKPTHKSDMRAHEFSVLGSKLCNSSLMAFLQLLKPILTTFSQLFIGMSNRIKAIKGL